MMNYTLENYEEKLRHQVVHMDQAVCYCPEFRATKMMNQYPSRRLQLARAIWLDQLKVSDYSGAINFESILSRQGERWQNFGECPEDCTDATILVRQMLLEKGYQSPATEKFQEALKDKKFETRTKWDLPMDTESNMAILLDLHTAYCGVSCEASMKQYCEQADLKFVNEAQVEFIGFEYFAYGLVEEGKKHLDELVEKFNQLQVEKVVVLSAEAAYMLTTFIKKLDIVANFEVVYFVDMLAPMQLKEKTYVYAGSFNLRYLRNADTLNTLVPSEDETQIPTSQEFIPLLKGNGRVNKLTIWQKPVSAEYTLYAENPSLYHAIAEDAIEDIIEAEAKKILVFEPTAYEILKDKFGEKKVEYYLNALKY